MIGFNLCLILILFSGLKGVQPQDDGVFYSIETITGMQHNDPQSNAQNWDYLIFTQHWPPTVCLDWVEKNPSHTCSMPKTPDSWTIHGIWPTRVRNLGPQFCNKTWLFDPEEVKPIEANLEEYWKNLEAGTALYDLWAHEWNKHGTCAAAIEPLNSQLKYFSKGLEWLQQFSMSEILERGNVYPSDDQVYNLNEFYTAVKKGIHVEPQIECRFERGGKQYLFEIRLCFTKTLQPIDCSVVYHMSLNASTNCLPTPGITYPATYSPPSKGLVQWYRLTTFLQWFTL